MSTTYLGSSSGLRLRHAQPEVRVELTGRSNDGTRSAWSGQGAAEIATINLAALEADVAKRLAWGERRIALDAGHYDTILPPTAVADLMLDAYWSAGALDAHEGQSVYSKAGGGTRVGEQLSDVPLTLRSDPAMPGQQACPFVVCGASSRMSSVFDNGAPVALDRLDPRRRAQRADPDPALGGADRAALHAVGRQPRAVRARCDRERRRPRCRHRTRAAADLPVVHPRGRPADDAADRPDPRRRVPDRGWRGHGAVNNFRFNESPVGMLRRLSTVGRTEDTLAREFGDYFTRTRMPALQIADFNMSSVSQAS